MRSGAFHKGIPLLPRKLLRVKHLGHKAAVPNMNESAGTQSVSGVPAVSCRGAVEGRRSGCAKPASFDCAATNRLLRSGCSAIFGLAAADARALVGRGAIPARLGRPTSTSATARRTAKPRSTAAPMERVAKTLPDNNTDSLQWSIACTRAMARWEMHEQSCLRAMDGSATRRESSGILDAWSHADHSLARRTHGMAGSG
jgi:hypothetical protein